MSIYVYNSLTRKKEEFIPLNPPEVNIYTCGVTVYDECHIGHARSLYIFDLIRRYLKYRNYKVTFVRNITDIEDKIINKAKQEKKSAKEITQIYIDSYYKDLGALSIERADFEPKATENIPEMIKHIQGLIKKGIAYDVGGDVYFSVRQFKDYGKLSGQSIEQMLEAVRIEKDPKKKDALDFALWKKSQEDEPFWESPWGKGRPGWHIECSVMSSKFLNTQTLDIHAGGRDLIFPHHENEIAQSEALIGKPFAKYWIHHGLLTINGQKMAKSLGNFITIQEALSRYPSDILKIFYLQAHYSSPIDFSWEKMEEAKKAYEHIEILMHKLDRMYGRRRDLIGGGAGDMLQFKNDFITNMDDDFNTPKALAVLFDMVKRCNVELENEIKSKADTLILNYAMSIIEEIAGVFGLTFLRDIPLEMPNDKIEFYIAARNALKQEKKYAEADKVRKDLFEKGIILEDTKEGTTWRRKL